MDSAKNVRRIITFKKSGMVRVKFKTSFVLKGKLNKTYLYVISLSCTHLIRKRNFFFENLYGNFILHKFLI